MKIDYDFTKADLHMIIQSLYHRCDPFDKSFNHTMELIEMFEFYISDEVGEQKNET